MEDAMKKERRKFLKTAAIGAAGAVGFSRAFRLKNMFIPEVLAGPKDIDLKDPTAIALKYSPDAAKADKKLRVDKMGVKGTEQFCKNCMFYTAEKDKKGKCTLLPSGLVAEGGWCTGWAAKPKA